MTMWLLIRVSGTYLQRLRLTLPGRCSLEHSMSFSVGSRKTTHRSRVSCSLRSSSKPQPWALSYRPLFLHTPTCTRMPIAFAGSSATSRATLSTGAEKSQSDTGIIQPKTPVPLNDVKRILGLAQSEKWRLTGKNVLNQTATFRLKQLDCIFPILLSV